MNLTLPIESSSEVGCRVGWLVLVSKVGDWGLAVGSQDCNSIVLEHVKKSVLVSP